MTLTITSLPDLDKAAPIVNPVDGRITPYFQRLWQNIKTATLAGAGAAVDITGKVDKDTSAGWAAASGIGSKLTFTTYAAPAISNPPTQAEVQAIANHVQILSQHVKALIDAGLTSELLTS